MFIKSQNDFFYFIVAFSNTVSHPDIMYSELNFMSWWWGYFFLRSAPWLSCIPFSFLPILPASLRGNKVASAHIPFFLSSPKERKGRLVMLRKAVLQRMWLHVETAPSNFGLAGISLDVPSTQTVDRWTVKWLNIFHCCRFCFCIKVHGTCVAEMFPPQFSCSLSSLCLLQYCSQAVVCSLLHAGCSALHHCVCCFLHKYLSSSLTVAIKTALRLCFAWLNMPFLSPAAQLRRSMYSMM